MQNRIALVSYHAFANGPYRPRVMHETLTKICSKQGDDYVFVSSDWDHISKKRFDQSSSLNEHLIKVPAYRKNLSSVRVVSHLWFSLKLLFCKKLWQSHLIIVCVPPSFSAFILYLMAKSCGKKIIIDVVDLWPEALPANPRFKNVFMILVGWVWVVLRNCLYKNADALICHCRYFIDQLRVESSIKTKYLPLTQTEPELFEVESTRASLHNEIRILVLGSINHVLSTQSLVSFLESLLSLTSAKVILEIVGTGESKHSLLEDLKNKCPGVQVIDHEVVYDAQKKSQILGRCHFGYNGYLVGSSIGVTYKSIDFSSAGLAIINSVEGDLKNLISHYKCGLNFYSGRELDLAKSVCALSDDSFAAMSRASKKIALDLFHPQKFESGLEQIIKNVRGDL